MFSKKATKIDKIFTMDFTYCQIDGDDFVNFCGLLTLHELYYFFKGFKKEVNIDKKKISNIYNSKFR